MRGIAVAQAAAAGDHLQPGVEHARKHAVLESLMQVANFPEFVFDPAGFDFLLETCQRRRRRIVFFQRFESGFGGEHAALDREMNSFQPRGI